MKRFLSDKSMEYVGKRVEKFRIALDKSQVDLAVEFSWNPHELYQWENGWRYPDISDMIKLSERYGVTLDYIYRGDMSRLPEWMAAKIMALALSDPNLSPLPNLPEAC